MAQSEITKLQQHLALLKQQYTKLQTHSADLEKKYNVLAASRGEINEHSFASRLLNIVSNLYGREVYSDITIKLKDREVPAHKIVLAARSNDWNEEILPGLKELNWSHLETEVGETVLLWLYTDSIDFSRGDELTLSLMRTAYQFKLPALVERCEQTLINSVCVRSCVMFYSVADEIGANALKEHCSALISAHWDDLTGSDFEHMSGPLLHKMLKNKTQYPLHSAVRLLREDVVFLCLVEHNIDLDNVVNVWGPGGELPLDLALRAHNSSIANTLVQHQADVNACDASGDTLLHRAIKNEDTFAAIFLLDNGADGSIANRSEGDSAMHLVAGAPTMEDAEKITQKLLTKNINPNVQNRQGLTALHIAIQADNEEIFSTLLNHTNLELNLKSTPQEHTALYYALLKFESGDNDEISSYAAQLIKKGGQTDLTYSSTCDSLLQTLIREGALQAAGFLCRNVKNINHVNSRGETALHFACLYNAPSLISEILSQSAQPNILSAEDRQTPLHYAVKSDNNECIKAFIVFNNSTDGSAASSVNFNVKDGNSDTPVSLALFEGFQSLVPTLIEGKADVNVRNGKMFTLLHQAILKEDSKITIFLLDHGADINLKTAEGESPLQLAIHCRLGEVVDALCVRGVDMSALDIRGSCPLWAALDSGQEDVASILVRHGVDTDCWGPGPEECRQTLLHRSIDENKEPAAIFLIQAGCDLDSPRMLGPNGEGGDEARDGASPLHLCCQWGLESVVQTLVEHGANVNSRDSENKTPLHIAIENQHPTIITMLLCHPSIDLSLRDKAGLSPFATALTFRNNKAAQAILDRLPSAAEQVDTRGQNFLHTAIKKNDIESVLFLLSVNVDVNSRVQDVSLTPPLHLAARGGNETLVRSLLLAGARTDDRDAHKRTALHIASEAGHAPVVSALLTNGANCDALNTDGDNALHVAVREGHLAVVRVLLTESPIDAEAVNVKGRNPLHELCRCGKENAAAICELFLECMSDYPINKPDLQGNTPLLQAYIKGQGQLCRVLVKAKACLAAENQERVTIFNYQVATKQLLFRLLDQLEQQVPWTTSDLCQECGKAFTLTMRKHHCRHCGRVLCSKCSDQEVPIIKFNENKPVRVCKVCFDVLQMGSG